MIEVVPTLKSKDRKIGPKAAGRPSGVEGKTRMDLTEKLDGSIVGTDAFRASREYWIGRLPTLPPSPELPLAANPASVAESVFNQRHAYINAQTWQSLKDRTDQLGLT